MKSSLEHLKEVLRNDPTVFEQLVALERDYPGKGVWGNTICPSDKDPMPWQSRAAVRTILPIIALYKMADRYEVADLKLTLMARFRSLLATSWNHSDVLLVIHAIIDTVHEHEVMNKHLFKEIKIRLRILLVEPRFMQFLERVPEFKTKVFEMTIRMLGDERRSNPQTYQAQGKYYCCRSNDKTGVRCRQNTKCVLESTGPTFGQSMKCTKCGQHIAHAQERIRLWESEDPPLTKKRDRAQLEGATGSGN